MSLTLSTEPAVHMTVVAMENRVHCLLVMSGQTDDASPWSDHPSATGTAGLPCRWGLILDSGSTRRARPAPP